MIGDYIDLAIYQRAPQNDREDHKADFQRPAIKRDDHLRRPHDNDNSLRIERNQSRNDQYQKGSQNF